MSRKKPLVREKAMTKSALIAEIAETTELTKKQVSDVFEELSVVIDRHISKRAVGTFTMPGLFKIKTVKKPATPARTIPNRFKPGEMMEVKAKPASVRVKITPLVKADTTVLNFYNSLGFESDTSVSFFDDF